MRPGLRLAAITLPVVLTFAFVAGCGSGRPTVALVRGQVTIDGKPVKAGRVMFYPVEGRAATGPIQPDGNYTLTTYDAGDGALLGSHKVTIQATELVGPP